MANLSLARKVAVAFIRPFRSYLDGTILLGQKREVLEKDIETRIDALISKAKADNPDIDQRRIEYARNCLLGINLQVLNIYDPSYEKVMPSAIDNLMLSLERELVLSFTDEDLEEVLVAIEKPGMRKLLTNNILFGALRDCEFDIENKMRMAIYDNAINSKTLSHLKDASKHFREDENNGEDFEEPEKYDLE